MVAGHDLIQKKLTQAAYHIEAFHSGNLQKWTSVRRRILKISCNSHRTVQFGSFNSCLFCFFCLFQIQIGFPLLQLEVTQILFFITNGLLELFGSILCISRNKDDTASALFSVLRIIHERRCKLSVCRRQYERDPGCGKHVSAAGLHLKCGRRCVCSVPNLSCICRRLCFISRLRLFCRNNFFCHRLRFSAFLCFCRFCLGSFCHFLCFRFSRFFGFLLCFLSGLLLRLVFWNLLWRQLDKIDFNRLFLQTQQISISAPDFSSDGLAADLVSFMSFHNEIDSFFVFF